MEEVKSLERLAENLLEGGFLRAFKPKLQPVQIAKALARAMERSQIVGVDGPLVANQYSVYLHPDDLAVFAAFQATLERELAAHLTGYAARCGLRPLSSPSVRLLPADGGSRPGRLRVDAQMVDSEPGSGPVVTPPTPPWQGTVEMPAIAVAAEVSAERPGALLLDEGELRLSLTKADMTIGRAIDNDIVLEAGGVSRHHARIVWDSDRYVLLDLDSTNGTYVSGLRVTRHYLSSGEELSFGGATFTFLLADPAGPQAGR